MWYVCAILLNFKYVMYFKHCNLPLRYTTNFLRVWKQISQILKLWQICWFMLLAGCVFQVYLVLLLKNLNSVQDIVIGPLCQFLYFLGLRSFKKRVSSVVLGCFFAAFFNRLSLKKSHNFKASCTWDQIRSKIILGSQG